MNEESDSSTETILHIEQGNTDTAINIDPVYVNAILVTWKISELIMLIISITSLLLVKSYYMETLTGRCFYLVTKHGIWIYLLFYVKALHFLERLQWQNWITLEIVYFSLWIMFCMIATYASDRNAVTDPALAVAAFIGLIVMVNYEFGAYVKFNQRHIPNNEAGEDNENN